ncbi:YjbF family lipoprotein [Yoonia sp.]|uniref:YjbF family lipoprotein n=1 Tax=Yoonia sp. TaxID=2212373 RepID=UPI003F6C135C
MRWLVALFVLAACAAPVDPAKLRAQLTPDQVQRLGVPLIFISAPRIDVAATLIPVRQNGGVRIWQARDGAQVAMRNGLITATHGMGHDLMAADLNGVASALAGGPSQYVRQFAHLEGDLHISIATYRCRMSDRHTAVQPHQGRPVRVFREDCQGPNNFENIYYIGPGGTVWWSRQWVSARVGALEIETVKP